MNYEEKIIKKVMDADFVIIDDKIIKDRHNLSKNSIVEIDYSTLDNEDNKYTIVSWDKDYKILKLKTII
jgi:hypothetical protein